MPTPPVPIRQWVLTLPYSLRYRLAYDRELLTVVLAAFVKSVFASHRRRTKDRYGDKTRTQPGGITFVQRFGGSINLNVHFHTLVLDGVYAVDLRARACNNPLLAQLYAASVQGRVPNGARAGPRDRAARGTQRRPLGLRVSHALGSAVTKSFVADVLACPHCGGRMRPVAIITRPREIEALLERFDRNQQRPP